MMVLLEVKEQLKSFYAKHAIIFNGVMKGLLGFVALTLMNSNIGYMERLKSPWMVIALSVLCAFLPFGAISFLMAIVMLVHIYTISFELTLITMVMLIMLALLYYGFQPRDSYWLLLTPIAFILKIPYVIPLLAGLAGGLISVIPVSCGVVIYYVMIYIKQNAGLLTNDESVDITQKYVQLIRALISNQTMFMMIAACAVSILMVYLIHNLSLDYSWIMAIVLGVIAELAVVFVGDFMFDLSVPVGELILGIFAALVIALIYHFFVFAVDYSRTENIQFEDDDYVYYVKAVPKIVVTKPDVQVKRINYPEKARQR
ncbi:MAG: ABC transporter permease [Lachnospiraceae bacterium]